MRYPVSNIRPWGITLLTAAICLVSTSLLGQEPIEWRENADLDRQLQTSMDLTWDSVPFREGLERLSQTQRIAIFLDRRIDPDQEISISFSNQPVSAVFSLLAAQVGASWSKVGSVIYIGPENVAKKLPTVAELQSQMAKSSGIPGVERMVDQKHYHWPKLSTPHDLLSEVASAHRMTWTNLDLVVRHDLWAAGDFPPLKTTEYLTLILAGYGATYRFDMTNDGVKLQLIPIPEQMSLTKVHRYAGNHADAVAKIKELFPEVDVKSDGKRAIEVTAAQEIQEEVAKLLRGQTARNTVVKPGDKVFTLTIQQQPLGPIVQALAPKLGLEAELPEQSQESLNQRISFSVDKASTVELLNAVFAGTAFTYKLDGKKLIVKPKP